MAKKRYPLENVYLGSDMVVLLLLLSHGGWNGPSVTTLSCTSESSKLVRDVVQKRFLSVVERYRVSLPLECPLHPRRDMFSWLQTELEATKVEGENTWHCPVCGQKFRCENTFVTHWDASHSRTLGMAEETVCLDDYCDVFRCDILRNRALRQRLEEDELRKIPKRQPPSIQSMSLFQHSQPQEDDDEETKEKKKNCDPRAMSQVHNKCRSLIRQCTIGMVANLSSKDFQDIEDDLDQAICSFLTCDKYWDDFDSHIHHVPVLVIAIFGLLSVSLFCFCYYGIWILIEKTPINSSQVCCNCQKTSSTESYYRQKHQKHRHRHNSPNYHSRQNSPEYFRQNSPEFIPRQNSPEFIQRQNSPEFIQRQNSPEFISRQNSPEFISRQNSPEFISRQNSPEFISRQNSPEFIPRQNSPEFIPRQNSPEFISRQNSPEYESRQNSPEFQSRQNSYEYESRHNSLEFESRHNSPEFESSQKSHEIESRQKSLEFESRQKSPEFESRQKSPEFESRQKSPEFESRQKSPKFERRQNSSNTDYNLNLPEFQNRHKSADNRYRLSSPEFIYSRNNTLQLPQRAPSRVN